MNLTEQDQLCFLHISKTAGTSLVATLSSFFEQDETCPAYHLPEIKAMSDEERDQYRFFRGHFAYNIRDYLTKNPVFITMLRHPVKRAQSLYQHILDDPSNNRHNVVKDLSFQEFVALDQRQRIEISNWQTRIITDQRNPKTEPDIELAKQRLRDEIRFVGLTERYAESMSLLSYTFGWPPIQEIKRLNTAKNPLNRDDITWKTMHHIMDINQLDMALYDFANELLDERLEQMAQNTGYATPKPVFSIYTPTARAKNTQSNAVTEEDIRYKLKPKDQLCFLHIGKTGGSTLRPILASMFKEEEVCPVHGRQTLPELTDEQLAQYKLISGHFMYTIHGRLPRKPVYITMLRHPIRRSISVYQHIRRNTTHPKHETLKQMSFAEYVDSEPDFRIDISNWQTRVITGAVPASNEPDLNVAKKRLRNEFPWVGLMEQYNESLRLLTYTFGWEPIQTYEKRNVAPNPMRPSDILKNVIERLIQINQKDLELYELGQQLFAIRFEIMMKAQGILSTTDKRAVLQDVKHMEDQMANIFERAKFNLDLILYTYGSGKNG